MKPNRITDPALFGKVAVVMGGASAEREISLKSGQAVLAALRRTGVDAFGVDIDDQPVAALLRQPCDRVFNMVHGRGGEDGVLQGVLEALGLPYTGSGVLASALSMNKLKTKNIWFSEGVPTPPWRFLASAGDLPRAVAELGLPLIVKPANEGSSIGMSKVDSLEALEQAWALALQYDAEVFAESWIEGREYTAGILDLEPLPLVRLETPHAFYDFEAKYCADSTRYHCPCGLDADQEKGLQALALRACATIGVTGWGRVDLLLDRDQRPWLIEVNTVPGMTDHSLIPMAAREAGIDFEALVWRILETSTEA